MKTIPIFALLLLASMAFGARVTHSGLKAYQSSIYNNKGILLGPERAIDGNYDNYFPNPDHDSCTHTNNEMNPWWAVDLQKPYAIRSLRLTIRNPFESRLANFIVGVSNTHPKQVVPVPGQYEVCSKYVGAPPAKQPVTVQCNWDIQAGRFVIIQLPAIGMLELCEVEIFVEDYNILSPSLFTYQSSTYIRYGRLLHPFLGINRDYTNSFPDNQVTCTHTNNELHSWWAVELDAPYIVTGVNITIRKEFPDRIQGAIVGVTNTSPLDQAPTPDKLSICGQLVTDGAMLSTGTATLNCSTRLDAAKFLVIQLPVSNFLELCEVEVYGDHA